LKNGKPESYPSRIISFIAAFIVLLLPILYEPIASGQDEFSAGTPAGVRFQSNHRVWQLGGYVTGGFPPAYEIHSSPLHFNETLYFFNGGLQAGRLLSSPKGPGFLRGRPEAILEVEPLWLAYIPKQTITVYSTLNQSPSRSTIQSLLYHGVSVTPLLPRWNFVRRDGQRMTPWLELGSGLLWTTKNFPQGGGPGRSTNRINFTPQVGVGEDLFTTPTQSVDVAVKAMHISSAGLGEYNPGVNVTLQFSVGYS